MANPDIKRGIEIPSQEQTPAEILVSKILENLGNSYFAQNNVRIEGVNFDPRWFSYKEIQIKKRGKLGSRRNFLGATAFFTLFADGSFIRDIEVDDKRLDKTSPKNIEGWTMGNGSLKLALKTPKREDIPQGVIEELENAGALYFPTAGRYLYRNDTTDSLTSVIKAIEETG